MIIDVILEDEDMQILESKGFFVAYLPNGIKIVVMKDDFKQRNNENGGKIL